MPCQLIIQTYYDEEEKTTKSATKREIKEGSNDIEVITFYYELKKAVRKLEKELDEDSTDEEYESY